MVFHLHTNNSSSSLDLFLTNDTQLYDIEIVCTYGNLDQAINGLAHSIHLEKTKLSVKRQLKNIKNSQYKQEHNLIRRKIKEAIELWMRE